MMVHLGAAFLPCIVHLVGPRGTGKTTLLRMAAALYGDPETLLASWNTTLVGMERLSESSRHCRYSWMKLGAPNAKMPSALW